jgi:hypothetical protein
MSLHHFNYSKNTIIALRKTIQISRALDRCIVCGCWCRFGLLSNSLAQGVAMLKEERPEWKQVKFYEFNGNKTITNLERKLSPLVR